MAFPDAFRFSMQPIDRLTWYYYQNAAVPVAQSATPRYIHVPDKWRETEADWTLSQETRGRIRAIAAPYNFVEDAARMLRSFYYTGSVEAKIYFLIERLNYSTMEYETFFDGEMDLSTFSDGTLYNGRSIAVSAAIIEGGVSAALDKAGNTPYLIPLGPDADNVLFDGLKLRGSYNYLLINQPTVTGIGQGMFMTPAPFVIQEGSYPVATTASPAARNAGGYTNNDFSGANGGTGNPVDNAYANYLLEAGQPMNLIVDFSQPNFKYSNNSTGGQVIRLQVEVIVVPQGASPYTFSTRQVIYQDANLAATGSRTLPTRTLPPVAGTSSSIALNRGDRVYLVYCFFKVSGAGAAAYTFQYDEGALKLSVYFRLSGTINAAYSLRTVIDKLLTAITGQTGVLQSAYLTNPNARYHELNPYNVRLTCGDALRGLTTNAAGDINITPAIRISWMEMVRYLKYVHGCGIDVRNGKVVIEPAAFFFDSSIIIADIGEVKSLIVEPARDFMAGSGKWGYPVQSYDHLNGRDEPNTTYIWNYPLTRITNQEDATVTIRTDPYGIEEARANLTNKKTIDATTDNTVFAVETEGSPVIFTSGGTTTAAYPLYRPQNTVTQPTITGFLFYDTMYNLTFLPVLNLRRNGGWIRGALYHLEGEVLKFQAADKNADIHINLGSVVIDASADILISSLDVPFFKPHTFNAEGVLRSTFLSAMRTNPSGCIRFTEGGAMLKGYPVKVGVKGVDDNSYQMILLCTEDSDITPLIQ